MKRPSVVRFECLDTGFLAFRPIRPKTDKGGFFRDPSQPLDFLRKEYMWVIKAQLEDLQKTQIIFKQVKPGFTNYQPRGLAKQI